MTGTLFHKTHIYKTIHFNEYDLLQEVIDLHVPCGKIDVDPTYSSGRIWSNKISGPELKFDIRPLSENVVKSDCRDLPLPDSSVNSVYFDPPFVIESANSKKLGEISSRFSSFNNYAELVNMYQESLDEFYRVLADKGILIFKCQDTVSGCTQYLTHVALTKRALERGFYSLDLFILLSKNRHIGNVKKQQHARKYHCYYLIFQKRPKKAIGILKRLCI